MICKDHLVRFCSQNVSKKSANTYKTPQKGFYYYNERVIKRDRREHLNYDVKL